MKKLNTPLTEETVSNLRIGEEVFLNGIIYTARDQAHQKIVDELQRAKSPASGGINSEQRANLPFEVKGAVIYYCGPTPAKLGQVIGSAGPTTSSRMDPYTPLLLEYGLRGTIGKGKRSKEVVKAMKKYKAVYFVVVGGAGAFLSKRIKKAEIVAYPELGPEAVYRLEVKDFPVIVANDIYGNDLFLEARKKYVRHPAWTRDA
mgnify:CR=1 FL=1